jgi:hypothetical protein
VNRFAVAHPRCSTFVTLHLKLMSSVSSIATLA